MTEVGLDVLVDESADMEVPASAVEVEAAQHGLVFGVEPEGEDKAVVEVAFDLESAVDPGPGVVVGAAIQD